jgi:hypothetical protein
MDQPLDTITVRLADEGVPLCALARAMAASSDTIRSTLCQAQSDGRLLELPKEDWPPGFPRDRRALQISRLVGADRPAVISALQQLFELTATQANLLLTLIQRDSVPKARTGESRAVHIHHLRRKLSPFGIAIATLWGYGYQLSADGRRRIMNMILDRLGEAAAK